MPDKSTNTTPRPSASNGRGTLGSTPLAASLEPTSSPDARPTSAVGQPGAAMADGAREECTRETRSRRRLFAGAALGAISENDKAFGKALIFVGLAEGVALYGLIVALLLLFV